MNKYVQWDLPNKKVVRKENKSGDFTTVNYTILRNKKLIPNAKLLMIEILSDSDGFRYSEQLFINRMNIGKSTYYRALNNLIENGYVRKQKIKNSNKNYYVISEYGNLNSTNQTDKSSGPLEMTLKETKDKKPASKEHMEKRIFTYLMPFVEFITPELTEEYHKMVEDGLDYYQIKSALNKGIVKAKKMHFKEVKNHIIDRTFSSNNNKAEAIKILKDEIFNKNKMSDPYRMLNIGSQNINRRKPLDEESLAADRASGI